MTDLFQLNTIVPKSTQKTIFNVVKAGKSVNVYCSINKCEWLTVSAVHSCFILYEKLLLQFINSLQQLKSEASEN